MSRFRPSAGELGCKLKFGWARSSAPPQDENHSIVNACLVLGKLNRCLILVYQMASDITCRLILSLAVVRYTIHKFMHPLCVEG